ncbi:MAG: hypothetical protein JO272_00030 [Pseudonocardiales bacterium]|nr:hypothetical protein [Pseudonocardiales bacterium]
MTGALSAPGPLTNEGTGLRWATAALDRGDLVAALVRNPASVRELADTYGAVPSVAAEVTDCRNPSASFAFSIHKAQRRS